MTGKDIDAARAEKIGLVNDVYDDAEASLAAAHATAAEIAANPPLVVNGIKDVLDNSAPRRCLGEPALCRGVELRVMPSKDLTEGISAMFAKRAPDFKGE